MKSLEEITVEKTISHMESGKDGIARKITRTYKNKVEVRTINAGLRFVHLITDYFVLIIIGYLIAAIPAINEAILALTNLIIILSYPLLNCLFEYYFQQTPGKMITGYIVINKFAQKPDFRTCLLRALIRYVPFEAFSCLGSPSRGWHDKWSDTYVVAKDYAEKLKRLVEKENAVTEAETTNDTSTI
ncbi:MAG: RDD family protein [Sporocytophaga sp.]|uniref:RDD family protein n=1 Tax=Sporocytophaga sp. TaxID=2231183 RepID=UPI001B2CC2CB|nr:RDD family protein [Sporocytophaga sp.]MBO9702746.1 RDD family protein [Sporocytophaga sp.]